MHTTKYGKTVVQCPFSNAKGEVHIKCKQIITHQHEHPTCGMCFWQLRLVKHETPSQQAGGLDHSKVYHLHKKPRKNTHKTIVFICILYYVSQTCCASTYSKVM